MPTKLWMAAVALARQHDMGPTVRGLRVDYASVKRRVATKNRPATDSEATFVDLGRLQELQSLLTALTAHFA